MESVIDAYPRASKEHIIAKTGVSWTGVSSVIKDAIHRRTPTPRTGPGNSQAKDRHSHADMRGSVAPNGTLEQRGGNGQPGDARKEGAAQEAESGIDANHRVSRQHVD